jgi:hypothetical protein
MFERTFGWCGGERAVKKGAGEREQSRKVRGRESSQERCGGERAVKKGELK